MAIGRRDAVDPCLDALTGLVDEVFEVRRIVSFDRGFDRVGGVKRIAE